jgi:8-oxo-dGTP pyrophosphatase MutT (NUDIX family)
MIVLEREGKFLFGKRADWKSVAPGFWCPISGHIEENETEKEAVIREAQEEIGVGVIPLKKIAESDTRDGKIRLHWWLASIENGEPHIMNDENSELRWVSANELDTLRPSFEEDLAIIREMMKPNT